MYTSQGSRDGGRYHITHRYFVEERYTVPVSIDDTGLTVLRNNYPASQSFTSHADDILNQAAGLDYKIVHEGINLPRVEKNGDLLDTYDRLNVVRGLGENTFRAMWGAVAQTDKVA